MVDIGKNNMVELVRYIINGDFGTFALDIGSVEYDTFIEADGKHVRSGKNSFTLNRMIKINIFNKDKTLQESIENKTKKCFWVSTDKAANPINIMGDSKRIMERFVMRKFKNIDILMARFANVAFSNGSLLHGFNQRIQKNKSIVTRYDIKRYFVTPQELEELCLKFCIYDLNIKKVA